MTMSIKNMSIYLLALILLLTASLSHAKVKTVTGQLRLMATLEGKPAFRPVTWQLTRSPHYSRSLFTGKKMTRHTVTLDLEPGTYYVSVSLNNKTQTRRVKIKESTKHFLEISLD